LTFEDGPMSTDTGTTSERPSWDPDEDRRWLDGQRHALLNGQETAVRTSTWWSEAAATLAELRSAAPQHFPKTVDGWEEWFETSKLRTHVDQDEFLVYLDQMVAACDAFAGDYRREGQRLGREQQAADAANAEAAARFDAVNAGKIPE
jgi:hypothetical protein